MQGVRVGENDVEEGMAGLVNGGRFLLFFGHGHAAAFAPQRLCRVPLRVRLGDFVFVALGGEERGFVDRRWPVPRRNSRACRGR